MTKGLIIGGTQSGAGKTTLTLGLMAALERQGVKVAPFKVGPDFIDPGHHAHVVGRTSRNLDGWMLSRDYNRDLFRHHAAACDVAVVEGVMGLFDGFSGSSEAGSTAQMSKWLDLPVLLVVNAASMARSAAALVRGFETFDPGVRFAGVVFNNLGSEGHLAYLKEAMAAYVRMPLLGGVVRDDALKMPERHLGLTTAQDLPLTEEQIDILADRVAASIDLDRLLDKLPAIPSDEYALRPVAEPAANRVRVGVAMDQAFCFYYPENLQLLSTAGVDWVPFSPLKDDAPPEELNGIYFGGGYPELFADRLADNQSMRTAIQALSLQGMPIYGECGGFMYLCRELEDGDGRVLPMCDCFPFRSSMHSRLRTLGYRQVQLTADTILGSVGQLLRGHEFHYSDIGGNSSGHTVSTVYSVESRKGTGEKDEGYQVNRTLGSYVHLHLGSCPDAAKHFADACRNYQKQKETGA